MNFRSLLRYILPQSIYHALKNLRREFLKHLKIGVIHLKARSVDISNNISNTFFVIYARLRIKFFRSNSYYSDVRIDEKLLISFSKLINDNYPDPMFWGNNTNHIGSDIFDTANELSLSNIVFKRNYLYGFNQIQKLLRSDFGFFLERKLKARPFIFNTQLVRVKPNKNGLLHLPCLPHSFQHKQFGIKGFLILKGTEGQEVELGHTIINQEVIENQYLNSGSFLEIPTNGLKAGGVIFDGDISSIDLLYIHAIPSTNNQILCQQLGWDTMDCISIAQSKSLDVPIISIPDKSEIYDRIQKKQIIGVNLGGAGHVFKDWVSIDTRYGYENIENLLPIWLSHDDPLPFTSNSLDFAYSSHFFEHVDERTVDFLLKDICRCLKKGGVFYITLPNFEAALKNYREGSWDFVRRWGFGSRLDRFAINEKPVSLELLTASVFMGGSPMISKSQRFGQVFFDGFSGGASQEDLSAILSSNDVEQVSKLLGQMQPKFDLTEHVNAFARVNFEKRLKMLGFQIVDEKKSLPAQELLASISPHKNLWDEISMNVCCIKI